MNEGGNQWSRSNVGIVESLYWQIIGLVQEIGGQGLPQEDILY